MGDKVSAERCHEGCRGPVRSPGLKAPCPKTLARSSSRPRFTGRHPAGSPGKWPAAAGGQWMRAVHTEAALVNAVQMTGRKPRLASGNPRIHMESTWRTPATWKSRSFRYPQERDLPGRARDCSMQRRHQKVIEEAPAPLIPPAHHCIGDRCADACCKIATAVPEPSSSSTRTASSFHRMNTRVQVGAPGNRGDHRRISSRTHPHRRRGEKLSYRQKDIACRGYAIECRINAETSSSRSCLPGKDPILSPARRAPASRWDTHIYQGYTVPPHYDSLGGKVIAYGDTPGPGHPPHANRFVGNGHQGHQDQHPCSWNCFTTPTSSRVGTSIHYLEQKLAQKAEVKG